MKNQTKKKTNNTAKKTPVKKVNPVKKLMSIKDNVRHYATEKPKQELSIHSVNVLRSINDHISKQIMKLEKAIKKDKK